MSEQRRLKWEMIRHILNNENNILISWDEEKEEFDFKFAGKNYMFARLFNRLRFFVKNWFAQWRVDE